MAEAGISLSRVLPDVPDAEDKLDFAPYANTLRNFILNPNTETPLTIGIFGSWGSGKTSLMKMIEKGLRRAARDGVSERQTHTIWFNAWFYSKEEALWRALVMQVLSGVRKWHRDDPAVLQDLNELTEHLHRAAGPAELGHLSIAAADLLKEGGAGGAQITLALQHGLDLLENIAQARQQSELAAAKTLHDQVRRATAALEQERIESLDRFQQEFRELIKKYVLPLGYLVIFVDDLDRCLPDKAVEVLEAIKLFLDVPGCIFILGIDRDVVERGIRLRYGEMGGTGDRGTLPFLVSDDVLKGGAARYRAFVQDLVDEDEDVIDGGRYLEKIIQIPFVLPPIGPDAMGRFIARLAPGLPDPECGLVFAQGLEPNPRQVKRAINIFTLMWELSRNKSELAPLIKPVRLAKLVVIQQRHSDLYDLLREDPEQLIAWETFFRRKRDHAGFVGWERGQGRQPSPEVPLLSKVAAHDLLQELEVLLTMHPLTGETVADANFVDLTADEVHTYVFLTRTVKESVAEPAAPPVTAAERMVKSPVGERRGVAMDLGIGVRMLGFITGMTYGDLDSLSERVVSEGELSPDLRQEALVSLAMAGSRIYAKVASDLKRQVEADASLGEPVLIQVSAAQSQAQVPWEIVYDRPLSLRDRPMPFGLGFKKGPVVDENAEIDVEGFWGFKHIIARPLAPAYEKHAAPPPEIPVRGLPAVNLGLDIASPQFQRVRETFNKWATDGLIDLAPFTYPPDFQEALVKRPADIYVLHGRGGTEGGEIWIGFGKVRLTRRLLESWKTGRSGSALFFLDVSAGLGRGNDWWAWLEAFRDLGAGGVVAPVVAPHPDWTLDFMTRFMEIFLGGKEAGAALLEARRDFFDETGNPMGLFYVHFGLAAQRLILPGGDEEEDEEGETG